MTDRYTFRISYVIDVDVEIDRSEETPNDRRTGNYEALNKVNNQCVPLGAREVVVATVRHSARDKPAAAAEKSPAAPAPVAKKADVAG
jgi:hypothetical protein